MRSVLLRIAPALFIGSLIGSGCGGLGVDSSLNEATVTGTVKVKGTPANGGQILFNPSNAERKVATKTATIGKDGHYSLTTYTGDNLVSLRGEVVTENQELGLWKQGLMVRSGENTADFDLLGVNDEGPKRRMTGIPQGASPNAVRRGPR